MSQSQQAYHKHLQKKKQKNFETRRLQKQKSKAKHHRRKFSAKFNPQTDEDEDDDDFSGLWAYYEQVKQHAWSAHIAHVATRDEHDLTDPYNEHYWNVDVPDAQYELQAEWKRKADENFALIQKTL